MTSYRPTYPEPRILEPVPGRWPWRRTLAFILSAFILGASLYHSLTVY